MIIQYVQIWIGHRDVRSSRNESASFIAICPCHHHDSLPKNIQKPRTLLDGIPDSDQDSPPDQIISSFYPVCTP